MTPAEHLAEAERILTEVYHSGQPWETLDSRTRVQIVLAHSLIATAAELGVPHAGTTTGGAGVTPPAATG